MNKKIGIVTFHRALSYGAVLQAYALQNFLLDNGIDNEIIDYSCNYMIEHYQKIFRKVPGNKLRSFAWNVLTAKNVLREKKTASSFVNRRLKLSRPYTADTICEAQSRYAAFIAGSDQVWSPTCVGFDPVYFLRFAKAEQKFSYAASIACPKIPKELQKDYKDRLSDFQALSLREKSGAEQAHALTGKETQVHMDPTLLFNRKQWDKIAVPPNRKEPYILLFTVLKPKNLIDFALKLGKEKNMKVLYLNGRRSRKDKNLEYLAPVCADVFIGLIKHASYVCTNSFHGNAFSVLYRKNFAVETDTQGKKNIRCEELMKKLGMEKYLLDTAHTPDLTWKPDWENIEKILDAEREKSRGYLQSIKDQTI